MARKNGTAYANPRYKRQVLDHGGSSQAEILKRRGEALGPDGNWRKKRTKKWLTQNVDQQLECKKESFQLGVAASTVAGPWANQTPTKFRCLRRECKDKKAGQIGFRDNSHLENHTISHSSERHFECSICPGCHAKFKQQKDQKRHCRERCKHRGCTNNGCQVQIATPQSAADDPQTPLSWNPLQNPPYTQSLPSHQDSPPLQSQTSPRISPSPQSQPHPQLQNSSSSEGLHHADLQSQHTPQNVSPSTANAEAITEPSSHFTAGDVVQTGHVLSGDSTLAAAVHATASEQSYDLELREDGDAWKVFGIRSKLNEGYLSNAALVSLNEPPKEYLCNPNLLSLEQYLFNPDPLSLEQHEEWRKFAEKYK